VLSAVAVSTAWRIENLNLAAGTYLPRKDLMAQGNPQWRLSPFTTEERWRWANLRKADGTVESRPLTEAEARQMRADIKRAKSQNEL
jgi:hypothetical protein